MKIKFFYKNVVDKKSEGSSCADIFNTIGECDSTIGLYCLGSDAESKACS
jgi:hypothetical protein